MSFKKRMRREERHEEKRDQTARTIRKVAGGEISYERTEHRSKERFRNGLVNGQASRQGSYDVTPVIRISQPEPVCIVCGKKITQIETSLVAKKFFPDESEPLVPSSDSFSESNEASNGDNPKSLCHFDCAIRYIRESRQLKPPYRISYVGGGNFAIFKYGKNKADFAFVEKIEFESHDDFKAMQDYVQGLVK